MKRLVRAKGETKCNNIIEQYEKLITLKKENLKEHNTNSPQTSDHPYGILTIRDSGSGKKQVCYLI